MAGLVCYAIFGGSRFAIVSPTSSSAAIIAAAAASVTTTLSPDEFKLAVAGAVLLTGGFFVGAGLARIGSLSNFISRPVLNGFAFGIGITIVAKQIATIAGQARHSGHVRRGLSVQSRCYFSVADAFDRARALTAA
jgi:MFS superfamily sulfate permease-like transporter